MNELRLVKISRSMLKKSGGLQAVRRARKRIEERFPIAGPILRNVLGEALPLARKNGTHRRRTFKPSKRRPPYEMALGFSLPFLAGSNGSSRLSIRTLFRIER